MISEFRGKYFFLSNFYSCTVTYNGVTYSNTEAAFHAQKCPARCREFSKLNPSEAKRLGRKVSLRKDWETVKDGIMHDIVKAKFTQNPDLQKKLLDTGTQELVEGTTWHDTYWGIDLNTGEGKNKLGKILMDIRSELSRS